MTDPDQQAAEDTLVALGNTDIIRQSWADEDGVAPGGIVGGDGAGDSACIRYLNRYLPQARITVYFYVVDQSERIASSDPVPEHRFHVEEMTEFYLADRPLTEDYADEVWSDYAYLDHTRSFATEAEAEAERDRLADDDAAENYRWDGTAEDVQRR